jgi:hypothetical protein
LVFAEVDLACLEEQGGGLVLRVGLEELGEEGLQEMGLLVWGKEEDEVAERELEGLEGFEQEGVGWLQLEV